MDPLLDTLALLGRLHGKPINRDAAVAGLPLEEGRLTPELFVRAAERCGFTAQIVKRSLGAIQSSLLPAVALTKNNGVAIIVGRTGPFWKRNLELIFPEAGGGTETIEERKFAPDYTGFAILVKPAFRFDGRVVADESAPRSKAWFWGTMWKFRGFYGKVAVASIVINLFALASSIFVMNVYDRVIPNQAIETLQVLAIGAAVVFGFELVLRLLRSYFVDRAGQRADILLASALFDQVLSLRCDARPASAGAFASQVRAYESLREFFTSATLVALVDLPFVLFFALVVYLIGGIASVPMLIGIAVVMIAGIALQIPLSFSVKKGYNAGTQRHAIVVETVSELESIKAAGAESGYQREMERCVRESARSEAGTRWISAIASSLTNTCVQLVAIAVVVVGVFEIIEGNLTMGGLIACVILSGRGMAPLAKVTSLFARLQQSRVALTQLNNIMKLPRERPARQKEAKPAITDFVGSIQLSEADFNYPEATTKTLDHFSLNIAAGETVALLGQIGCGKSTLLKLILRLYEPSNGVVQVSGRDVRQIDHAELRRHIGYVAQQSTLVHGTIRSNIALGVPWADDEQIRRAAEMAGVDRFTDLHPLGLEMPVGERGALLSGGQRQSVALARAFVSEPDILLLDEPTSGMDMNAQAAFSTRLRAYLAARPEVTMILVTHKMDMIQLADRVVVMSAGKVDRDGSTSEVLAKITKKRVPKSPNGHPILKTAGDEKHGAATSIPLTN